MKADYLTLTNGQKVRILWNMNALGEWTSYTGREMNDLASARADVATLRSIAWCAAREGEEAEGRKLEMDEKEFGRLMDMPAIVQFVEILNSQTSGAAQKKSAGQPKFPLNLLKRQG